MKSALLRLQADQPRAWSRVLQRWVPSLSAQRSGRQAVRSDVRFAGDARAAASKCVGASADGGGDECYTTERILERLALLRRFGLSHAECEDLLSQHGSAVLSDRVRVSEAPKVVHYLTTVGGMTDDQMKQTLMENPGVMYLSVDEVAERVTSLQEDGVPTEDFTYLIQVEEEPPIPLPTAATAGETPTGHTDGQKAPPAPGLGGGPPLVGHVPKIDAAAAAAAAADVGEPSASGADGGFVQGKGVTVEEFLHSKEVGAPPQFIERLKAMSPSLCASDSSTVRARVLYFLHLGGMGQPIQSLYKLLEAPRFFSLDMINVLVPRVEMARLYGVELQRHDYEHVFGTTDSIFCHQILGVPVNYILEYKKELYKDIRKALGISNRGKAKATAAGRESMILPDGQLNLDGLIAVIQQLRTDFDKRVQSAPPTPAPTPSSGEGETEADIDDASSAHGDDDSQELPYPLVRSRPDDAIPPAAEERRSAHIVQQVVAQTDSSAAPLLPLPRGLESVQEAFTQAGVPAEIAEQLLQQTRIKSLKKPHEVASFLSFYTSPDGLARTDFSELLSYPAVLLMDPAQRLLPRAAFIHHLRHTHANEGSPPPPPPVSDIPLMDLVGGTDSAFVEGVAKSTMRRFEAFKRSTAVPRQPPPPPPPAPAPAAAAQESVDTREAPLQQEPADRQEATDESDAVPSVSATDDSSSPTPPLLDESLLLRFGFKRADLDRLRQTAPEVFTLPSRTAVDRLRFLRETLRTTLLVPTQVLHYPKLLCDPAWERSVLARLSQLAETMQHRAPSTPRQSTELLRFRLRDLLNCTEAKFIIQLRDLQAKLGKALADGGSVFAMVEDRRKPDSEWLCVRVGKGEAKHSQGGAT
ncbi:unnamed protein product [Vitrella brassicaformis CCMP3155]|uniref:Uncharacterized protein n=1 Tax=Vitrella brassicaformis (strain CCMP3155) TaxID=1169540 RepID=A0A0G4GQ54_VITBC|nr:unnamed protein product [Vitrella brassicaformis CCMP3155]|eukprot:CEM32343.1 unnamed protein product [Vitrella brassicaformis CCMP3155]